MSRQNETQWSLPLYLQRNPWLVFILPWWGTLGCKCFRETITPLCRVCKWLYAGRLFRLEVFCNRTYRQEDQYVTWIGLASFFFWQTVLEPSLLICTCTFLNQMNRAIGLKWINTLACIKTGKWSNKIQAAPTRAVSFGNSSSLRIYHSVCTSSTDIHAPPVAPPTHTPSLQSLLALWFPPLLTVPPPPITPIFSPEQKLVMTRE